MILKKHANFSDAFIHLVEHKIEFCSIVLTEILGSAPQTLGARLLFANGKIIFGTVGGGKLEARALEFAKELLATNENIAFKKWNLQKDLGMTCGGKVSLYFEIFNRPKWNIVIFGAGHVAAALVSQLQLLDCQITCIDSREEWLNKLPNAIKTIQMEEPVKFLTNLSREFFVVIMTRGHAEDFPILKKALTLNFKYLGVMGSLGKRKVLERELLAAGVDLDLYQNFLCPIGLDLGNNTPAEIAVSIAAQLLQTRDTD